VSRWTIICEQPFSRRNPLRPARFRFVAVWGLMPAAPGSERAAGEAEVTVQARRFVRLSRKPKRLYESHKHRFGGARERPPDAIRGLGAAEMTYWRIGPLS
jgi:hypothetical protein